VVLVVEVEAMGHLGPQKTELLTQAVAAVALKHLDLVELFLQQAALVLSFSNTQSLYPQ